MLDGTRHRYSVSFTEMIDRCCSFSSRFYLFDVVGCCFSSALPSNYDKGWLSLSLCMYIYIYNSIEEEGIRVM